MRATSRPALSMISVVGRPRTPDELDVTQGGGIPYRQGPHQIDTVRLLGGGMLRSVRAQTGWWMKERTIPGYYSAFMEFESGLPATIDLMSTLFLFVPMILKSFGSFSVTDASAGAGSVAALAASWP